MCHNFTIGSLLLLVSTVLCNNKHSARLRNKDWNTFQANFIPCLQKTFVVSAAKLKSSICCRMIGGMGWRYVLISWTSHLTLHILSVSLVLQSFLLKKYQESKTETEIKKKRVLRRGYYMRFMMQSKLHIVVIHRLVKLQEYLFF